MLMRLMRFNVTAEYVPGKQLVVADALSRRPLDGDVKSDMDGEMTAYVNTIVASKPIRPPKLEEIRRATQCDAEPQKVMTFIRKGWPQRMPEFSPMRAFHAARAQLSETDGLVLYQVQQVQHSGSPALGPNSPRR